MTIPKIIHQTYYLDELKSPISEVVTDLRAANPDWTYKLYNDYDCFRFIRENYGHRILKAFNSINPIYGAARADFFRYLLMYKLGGVYLDIKSTVTKPLDAIVEGRQYILSHWDNEPIGTHPKFGLVFSDFPWGEFQQWHIICVPEHPFLLAVITKVLDNIEHYDEKIHGVGWWGTLNTTGPIPYTTAIASITESYNHIRVRKNNDLGLIYNYRELEKYQALTEIQHSRPHYSRLNDPIVFI